MNKERVVKAIIKQGFLPLYFHPDENISVEILSVLYESGVRVVEYHKPGQAGAEEFEEPCQSVLYTDFLI